jgi:type 2 lantibiotic biosynthesis protein LanM
MDEQREIKAMKEIGLKGLNWYRGLSLRDRILSLGAVGDRITDNRFNQELANRRIQRWRSQKPLTNEIFFAKRLALDGIAEKELHYLLGESMEMLAARNPDPPDWLREIEAAFSSFDRGNVLSNGFISAIAPLIQQGRKRLNKEISALIKKVSVSEGSIPFDPNTIESVLFEFLPEQLHQMLNTTMVLELNVARLQGLLSGKNSQERYQSFLQRLQNPETCILLLQEYPVLAQQLVTCIQGWVGISLEFVRRLLSDWKVICTTFFPGTNPGILREIKPGAGDCHNGGRTVTIVKFSSGLQIVYKPKPLAVDAHFQELLVWINQKSDFPSFLCYQVIDRGNYGWVEFVPAKSCQNTAEVERFYQRLGGYLALLYTLQGTDFHAENAIAAGEHPVLVDLESLFQPHPVAPDSPNTVLPTRQKMSKSVLRIGLLPRAQLVNSKYEAVDPSGIGGNANQIAPDSPTKTLRERVPSLADVGTDEMKVVRQVGMLRETQNQPRLHGKLINVLEYSKAIEFGFSFIYQLLIENREELKEILTSFANDEVRIFLRETRSYSLLLRESFHPDVLRDALDRDRFFDKLWVEVPQLPYLELVIPAERKALWQGDIPKFTTRANSRHLWLSDGEYLPDFFPETGIELVQRRLQELNKEDLNEQLWFIQTSLQSLAMVESEHKVSVYSLPKLDVIPDETTACENYLNAARAVAKRLTYLAIRDQELAGWIAPILVGSRHWAVSPLGWDLFDGIPGLALFLAYLGALDSPTETLRERQESYTNLADAALNSLRHQLKYESYLINSIGGFNGWGGLIYTFAHLGTLWQKPELIFQAVEWVKLLPPLIAKDEQLDIIGGAAGCIVGLITLYQCVLDPKIKAVAIECGDRLIARSQIMEKGIGWVTIPGCKPLTGFSHGAAGIAYALLQLAAFTGEERFQKTAISAMNYENHLFSKTVKNWSDLRIEEPGKTFYGWGWSHGAPGIGLGRLHSLSWIDNAEIRADIKAALETTKTRGFGYNHSLCTGDLGNLELLNSYQYLCNFPQERAEIHRLAANILASIEQQGWICDIPLGGESLGLMKGIAGIGYGFLRLAAPDRIPSVLILAPPN